ncbi:MAG: hypothetical protein LBH46_04570 [Rickettsiales bacterium]|nr:hypothetical protein [Rickettsiales bacterium]
MVFLSSCVKFMEDSKFIITEPFPPKEDSSISLGPLTTFVNGDFYTQKNITKIFGEPISIEKDEKGDTITLNYEVKFYQPESSTLFLLLPITTNNDNDVYKYSFFLKRDKLKSISYEHIKKEYTKIEEKTYYSEKNLFNGLPCRETLFGDIRGNFSHLPSNEVVKVNKDCGSFRLFDMDILQITSSSGRKEEPRYTKVGLTNIIAYNKNILDFRKAAFMDFYRKSLKKADEDRCIDPIFKEEDFKTEQVDCKIFTKIGKDYKAPNKGSDEYLIIEIASAICFPKQREIMFEVRNSSRYPKSIVDLVDTLGELKESLKTIKISK